MTFWFKYLPLTDQRFSVLITKSQDRNLNYLKSNFFKIWSKFVNYQEVSSGGWTSTDPVIILVMVEGGFGNVTYRGSFFRRVQGRAGSFWSSGIVN